MIRLLIVDDEKKIRQVIKEYAVWNEMEVSEAGDGMEAVEMCRDNDYDIIIMDVMMPKLDGFSAVKEIRKSSNVPIIMLSARGEEYDKLFGFELGIDDYVVKPFSPKELMARIGVILSRSYPADDNPGLYVSGGLEINIPARTVEVDGEIVELTPMENDLLLYLLDNKNVALSREQLMKDVWGYDFYADDRTIDTHIKNLRNNLGPYRNKIVTLRGVGYKFEA